MIIRSNSAASVVLLLLGALLAAFGARPRPSAASLLARLPAGSPIGSPLANSRPSSPAADVSPVSIPAAYRRLEREQPLRFERNQGQTDPRARFLARGRNYALFLTATEAVIALRRGGEERSSSFDPAARTAAPGLPARQPMDRSATLRMRLVGANAASVIRGANVLSGRTNYLVGNDPKAWRKNVPSYGRVEYQAVYPGIDMAWYGNGGRLEHDFRLAPGADPRAIRVEYGGIAASGTVPALRVDAAGNLLLPTPAGELRQRRPVAYQEVDGKRRPVAARYTLVPPASGSREDGLQVGFQVGAYNKRRPLVIDPVLEYATYLGGSKFEEIADWTFGPDGSIYLLGATSSVDFPTTPGAFQREHRGQTEEHPFATSIFITRVAADGSSLLYSTFFGGAEGEEGPAAIAVDSDGSVWITGRAASADFPTVPPVQTGPPNDGDAFVSHLNATGSTLLFSTYKGGGRDAVQWTGNDTGVDIAVDANGDVYVAGYTTSHGFPTTPNAIQRVSLADAGTNAGFVMKFRRNGTLVYSSFLSGIFLTWTFKIAPDGEGGAYVLGETYAPNFPVEKPAQPFTDPFNGSSELFLARVNATGNALIFSTFLGGNGNERVANPGGPVSIPMDAQGNLYVAGSAHAGLPTTPGAFQRDARGTMDAFLAKYTPRGALVFCTRLGGTFDDPTNREEGATAFAVDPQGNAYLAGITATDDFPIRSAVQPTMPGPQCAFATKFDPTGQLLFSTYLGGSVEEWVTDVAADSSGRVFVAGRTISPDLPLVQPLRSRFTGPEDGFLTELAPDGSALLFSTFLGATVDGLGFDGQGGFYTLGRVGARVIPVKNAIQPEFAGRNDLFVMKFLLPPDPPTDLTATAASISQIDLAWQDHSATETGFQLERQTGANAFARITTTGKDVTAFSDRGLRSKTTYRYRVRAVGAGGASAYSNVAEAATFPDLPAAPTELVVRPLSSTSLRLTWRDQSRNETGFEIERKPGGEAEGGSYRRIVTTAVGASTYTDSGLSSDTTYSYRVRAVNADGPSAYSDEAEATTLPPPPTAPTGLTARATASTQVELAWADRSENESHFQLERQVGTSGFARIATVEANSTGYTDAHAPTESALSYRLRAVNAGGPSRYSNSAPAQTLAAPTALQRQLLGSTQVRLTWQDRSGHEGGYAVERRTEAEEFAVVATSGANTTAFTDGQGTPDTLYYYRVRARRGADASSPTSEVRATPLAAPEALAAVSVGRTVLLSWSEPGDAQSGARIERRAGSGAFQEVGMVGRKVGEYTDRSVSPHTRYTYRVRASSSEGFSSYSNLAEAQTPDVLPAAPSGLTATVGYGTPVELAWHDGSDNEREFQVERKGGPGGGSFRLIGTSRADQANYEDRAVRPSVTYTYRVRAVNGVGVSGYSNEARATPLPALLSLTVRPARVRSGGAAKGTVTLTGAAPAGGATVQLSRSLASLSVPGSVKVAAGKKTASFRVKAKKVKKRQAGTVSADYGGVTKTAPVTVAP